MDTKPHNVLNVALHLAVWFIILFIPFLMLGYSELDYWRDFPRIALSVLEYAVVFYFNYFVLVPLLFFKRRFSVYVLVNGCLISAIVILNHVFHAFFFPDFMGQIPPEPHPPFIAPKPHPMFGFFIWKDMVSLGIPVLAALATKAIQNWIKIEAKQRDTENKQLEFELMHLRYQIQPHFFFNSLNNIYALIGISQDRAKEAVHGLSKLMRYMLYDTEQPHVRLSDEIAFLKNYIQLMELRQNDKVTTVVEFPELNTDNRLIAPLLFIPLIENAYKHGVSASHASSLRFVMILNGDWLTFMCENTSFPKSSSDISGSGIGLDNLRKRLDLLYPDNYSLEMETDGGFNKVKLILNLAHTSS